MNIAFIVSEMYPLIKTGGLADVAYALPKALKKKEQDIRVFIPKYLQMDTKKLEDIKLVESIEFKNEIYNILEGKLEDVTVYLIENRSFFERDSIYDNFDRDLQFAIFSEISLRALEKLKFKPDVIHLNDWQTGLIPYLLKIKSEKNSFYKNIKTLFTIHNLRYQGIFGKEALTYIDYPFEDNELNYMKVALLNSSKINTVSKTYAREIQTKYFGEGLEEVLKNRSQDLYGIINGIDYDIFNPETDINLKENYSINTIEKKKTNKISLQKYFDLNINENTALISMVTRLDSQKGLDLLDHIICELLEQSNIQLVILGSGMERYERRLLDLEKRYPDKLALELGYNAKLANQIYAGSDIFLMPSQFEPCGLSQLIALKYGSVPIVRETGGLNDTIEAYNEFNFQGNGFSFANYNAHDLLFTIKRAINIYYELPENWLKIMKQGMAQNFSWANSAEEYLELYKKL